MKLFRFLSFFWFCPVLFISISCCRSDDPTLTVITPEGTEFEATGETKSIQVQCDGEWMFTVNQNDEEWLTWNFSAGRGNQTVYFKASRNDTPDIREASLTFTNTEEENIVTIILTQTGVAPILKVSSEKVSLSVFADKQVEIIIESNTEWTIQTDKDWLRVSPTTGKGTAPLFISSEENDGDLRNGTITVLANKFPLSRQIAVSQKSFADAIYREPCISWEASMSDVKAFMNSYSLYSEDATQLLYEGKYKEFLTEYRFDNNKLERARVALYNDATTKTALVANINENGFHAANNTIDGYLTFTSYDGKTLAILEELPEYDAFLVNYKDYKHLFPEPYTRWGQSKENVRKVLEKRGYSLGEENSTTLLFAGKKIDYYSEYDFDVWKKLYQTSFLFDPNVVNFNEICSYLGSTYGYSFIEVNADRSGHLYRSSDGNTVALVQRPTVDFPLIILGFISYERWEIINSESQSSPIKMRTNLLRRHVSTFIPHNAPILLIGN